MRFLIGPAKFLYHHALKMALVGAIPLTYLFRSANGHWISGLSVYLILVLLVTLLSVAAGHAYFGHCSKCQPLSAEKLRRPFFRGVAVVGRYGGWVLGLLTAAFLVISPFTVEEAPEGNPLELPQATWKGTLAVVTVLVFFVGVTAASRFQRVNYPDLRAPGVSRLLDSGKSLMHRMHWVFIISALAMIVLAFAPRYQPVVASLRGMFSVLYTVSMMLNVAHRMRLCETCVTEFRTDAAEYASRKKWRFTVVHKYLYGVLAVSMIGHALAPWITSPALRALAVLMGCGAGISVALLGAFHGKYQPWCRYCRRGGGGEDFEPAPDPTGGHGRPLPVA